MPFQYRCKLAVRLLQAGQHEEAANLMNELRSRFATAGFVPRSNEQLVVQNWLQEHH
jgi:hypothetical protein